MAQTHVNAKSPAPQPAQATPLAQPVLRRTLTSAVVFGAAAILSFSFGMLSLGIVLTLLASLYGWSVYSTLTASKWVALHNQAFEHATRGLLEEAEAISGQLPKRARERGAVMRAQAILHAFIALQRGRFEDGVAHATRAIEGKDFVLWGAAKYANLGLGIRAVLYASLGREELCLADIARAENDEHLQPVTWARCKLANAILASKNEHRRTELVTLLREGRSALEQLSSRERVLFRALESLVRIDAGAAYRESGQRVEQADAQALALSSWVASVVPGAVDFVKESQREEEGSAEALEAEFAPKAAPLRAHQAATTLVQNVVKNNNRGARKSVALWVVLILALLGVYSAVQRTSSPREHVDLDLVEGTERHFSLFSPEVFLAWFPWTLVVLVVGLIAYRTVELRRAQKMLVAASMHKARGNVVECTRILDALASSKKPGIAASALHNRANERELNGDFSGALADLDLAMIRLNLSVRSVVAATDLVHPAIIASRAFTLAVLGRIPEAEADYTRFVEDYPAYPFAMAAKMRVRVAIALREGDEGRARAIAKHRTMDLPLTLQDELLYDLLDLAANPSPSRDELSRMREEFSHAPDACKWVDVVAPGLRARVLSGAGGTRVSAFAAPMMQEVPDDETAVLATQRGAV